MKTRFAWHTPSPLMKTRFAWHTPSPLMKMRFAAAIGGAEGLAAGLRDRERYTCRTGLCERSGHINKGAKGCGWYGPHLRALERGCLTTPSPLMKIRFAWPTLDVHALA